MRGAGRFRFLFSLFALSCILIFSYKTKALQVSDINNCADVLLVFARGSGDNSGSKFLDEPFSDNFKNVEKVPGTFFQKFRQLLDQNYPHVKYKAVSVHNFPDKYDDNGYTAPGIFGKPTTFITTGINADVAWWPFGEYQDSIRGGRAEISGYVRDEVAHCPDQKIVLGGYSQGAQVMGESTFDLNAEERTHVAGMALFGDPKNLSGYEFSGKSVAAPWKRGDARNGATGLAEARVPYVPDDMAWKTLSWCYKDDFICTNTGTLFKKTGSCMVDGSLSKDCVGAGHLRYITFGAPQAADEIFQRIAPGLYSIDKSRGGVDKELGPTQPVPTQPNPQPVDVMFLVDVSYNMDDVLASLRVYTDNVMPVMKYFFPNVRYGIADVSEQSYGLLYPRYNFHQDLSLYQAPTYPISSSTLTNNFIRKLSYGGLSGGGVDRADPLGLAVEKTTMRASWNPDAVKHIILITDRPAKDPYTYNICDGVLQTNIGLPPLSCTTTPGLTTLDTNYHPEICETAWLVITQNQCTLTMPAPGPVHSITRKLNDYISVAQAHRVDVNVVVPHPLRLPDGPNDRLDANKQLEYFAKATAGLYLKYNGFDRAAYSDMIWQILNHRPKNIALAYKDALDVLGDGQVLGVSKTITAKTNVPVVFDVSQSNLSADTYKWDFDGDGNWDDETPGPNTEHTFTNATTGQFMRVTAFSAEEEVASTSLPLTVESYDGPIPYNTPPALPELHAVQQLNGDIQITWSGDDPNMAIVICAPDTGLPIVSVPANEGGVTIPSNVFFGTALQTFAASETSDSARQTIEIEQLPLLVENYPVPDQTLTLSNDKNIAWLDERTEEQETMNSAPSPEVQQTNTTNVQTASAHTAQNNEPSTRADTNSRQVLAATDLSTQNSNSKTVTEDTEQSLPPASTNWPIILIIVISVGSTTLAIWRRYKKQGDH
jgi:hypothetical protein